MLTETLSALTEPTKGVLEPIQKLNRLSAANVEKLAARQIESLQTYSDLWVNQLKAAAEVKDIQGLQDLMSKQKDVLSVVVKRLWTDTKAVAETGVGLVSQVTKVGASSAPAAPAEIKVA